ncbi:AMP-dependent synthetase and ligase [Corallococcus coralloides DSM 2259]|uniref:AMP-dependent synthetase and ligase n=1 Tax=Corallococcus coralloides (strain ATCC 25202 / DSM 2259 / NBRC 100086 / M2) TaxID=1144275 RepID=H8MRC5_CORCM|nr:fatty acyl-AMP ligase [Corallococcus coralloides]AFE08734.1 AMP-dependent synthetase and ligase [Corallococcus coralloides DSM 2259]
MYSNLVDLLRDRAQQSGDALAFIFVNSDGSEQSRLTFAQLDREARGVAAELRQRLVPGDRALLLFPPGLEFISAFFGCLYAGVIGVPAYPIRAERDVPRLREIVRSAGARVALSTQFLVEMMSGFVADVPEFSAMQWLSTDAMELTRLADTWRAEAVTGDHLAFLQYTSGSTGKPRGVMVSHQNLLHNERMIQEYFQHDRESTIVAGWLPVYHDMGLIGNVLQPLFLGRPCILMSPLDFLQRPAIWLQTISQYKVTTSGGPNFAYELCIRRINAEQRQQLDLSTWSLAFNGAEPIRGDVLRRFAEVFGPQGFKLEAFYPCYGLAEATLIVTGGRKAAAPVSFSVARDALERRQLAPLPPEDPRARELIGCGSIAPDQQLLIVDPETSRPCAPEQVGEVWVRGPSVARGYWEQPEATQKTFGGVLADTQEERFLRTGDLGFLRGGELFITGRLKDVIIIRGRNHYPEDIELTVERSSKAVRPGCGAAFAVDVAGEEQLVLVQEISRAVIDQGGDLQAVIADIREAISANHGVRLHSAVLIPPGVIPKTSSGKIQRHACRTKFLEGSLEQLTP